MSKKVKITPEEKEFVILKYRESQISFWNFVKFERIAIYRWCIEYDTEGSEGIKEIRMNKDILLFRYFVVLC